MNRYTIYCTEEQTKKALELGAPIEKRYNRFTDFTECILDKPTAEQMIMWLEEQEPISDIDVYKYNNFWYYEVWCNEDSPLKGRTNQGRKEATLAAIDAALEYLIQRKGNRYDNRRI